jgi:hypothetical protein
VDPDPGAQKHVDPVDPDPQHCEEDRSEIRGLARINYNGRNRHDKDDEDYLR